MQHQLSGVLVLDKPDGLSSARALSKVKALTGARKAGHAGTLDPFATGILVCCLNQATRLAQFFLFGEKTYEATLRLGIETDTQDATGSVTARSPVPPMDVNQLQSVFQRFVGRVQQQPPIYSALKHKGTALYKLARSGRPVQKPARRVTISAIRIVQVDLPWVRFDVTCSAGTYIRTLCADIGRLIGCGGLLARLRRTRSGHFDTRCAVDLAALADATPARRRRWVIPMANALKDMPALVANAQLAAHIACGKALERHHVQGLSDHAAAQVTDSGHLKVVQADGRLIAVIRSADKGQRYDYCCVFNT